MIETIRYAFYLLFRFLEAAILVDVILSWVMPGKRNVFIDLVHVFTDPFMIPGRKIQNRIAPNMMIDFSPIIALILIDIIQNIIFSII